MSDKQDFLSTLYSRASVRDFTVEPISEAQISQLLKAGMAAPSGWDARPWAFIVVTDRDLLNQLKLQGKYFSMLSQAACAIVVCGEPEKEPKAKGLWMADCAAATENILLAAHALGLGGVWLGVHPDEEKTSGIAKVLNIPKNFVPYSMMALGHPTKPEDPTDKFDPGSIHFNGW